MKRVAEPKAPSRIVKGQLARFVPLASFGALIACSALIGIEDVHEGPAPGSAGSSPAGGGGGTPDGGSSGTRGGSAGKGQGGGAGAGQGGSSGDTSFAGTAGDLGAAGVGGGTPGDTTVTGHVIDYWGHRISNIPVQIGETMVTTDDQGAFTIPNVPAQYDVSLVVDFAGDYPRETYGWVYLGLTRRNPTLQVYSALAKRGGNIQITPTNAALDATRNFTVSLGGPDGDDERSGLGATGTQTSTNWRGPATTNESAHGLIWQFDATSKLPTAYLAYATTLVALSDSSDTSTISLNMKASAIASGNLTGTVTPGSGTQRGNQAFLRFTSNAAMKIVDDSKGPDKFSYLVPTVPNGSVTFAAFEGDAYYGSYAVAHKEGLAANNAAIALSIPSPATPLVPTDSALNVGENSTFTFTAGKTHATGFVVSMIANKFFDGLFVVTTNKSFKVPRIAGGAYSLVSTHTYDWRIETHGDLATTDAMTGPQGFMDSFSRDQGSPTGPNTASGSFTVSVSNGFTAK